jgi:TPP-dependent indolepyruvate ferredoxin oxidoreductase alpha subunit
VVEEKHAFIESQMKESMYNWTRRAPVHRRQVRRSGEWILPSTGELTPARIARVIAKRIQKFHDSEHMRDVLRWMEGKESELALPAPRSRACRTTARAARTTPRPSCPKARARWAASVAITW